MCLPTQLIYNIQCVLITILEQKTVYVLIVLFVCSFYLQESQYRTANCLVFFFFSFAKFSLDDIKVNSVSIIVYYKKGLSYVSVSFIY